MVEFAATAWTQCYLINHITLPFKTFLKKSQTYKDIFNLHCIYSNNLAAKKSNLYRLIKLLVNQILLC